MLMLFGTYKACLNPPTHCLSQQPYPEIREWLLQILLSENQTVCPLLNVAEGGRQPAIQ